MPTQEVRDATKKVRESTPRHRLRERAHEAIGMEHTRMITPLCSRQADDLQVDVIGLSRGKHDSDFVGSRSIS